RRAIAALLHRHPRRARGAPRITPGPPPTLERPGTAARVMTRRAPRPPALAEWLLASTLPDEWIDTVLGGLHEEHARAAETARCRAHVWYVGEAVRLSARYGARAIWERVRMAPRPPAPERSRGDSVMRTIGMETRYAVRSLAKRPGLTALVV